ncbi:hypothetical protein WDV76_04150 [Xenorhabdus griffiniae]|uniref:hypothetical protein n=1 Tax=Xenorhabdus griffiniae TaxID=351672 RepID=UPI0030CC0022
MGFDISRHFKMSLEAQCEAALRLERAVEEVGVMAIDTVENIGLGAKRALWRTSYFWDGYEDVNEKINADDKRMIINLWTAKNEKDFIMRMAVAYVDELFKDYSEDARERIYLGVLKFSAKVAAFKSTKLSISIVVAEFIYRTLITNILVKNIARKFINMALSAFQSYGYFEKAAVSADKLKRECPSLYWALYSKNLEMMYFIVEPVLSKGTHLIGKKGIDKPDENSVARVISDIIDF